MTDTDSPLKVLAHQYIHDIASWLLGEGVTEAEEVNPELTAKPPRADLVFRLKLANERRCLFHLEFQGRSSRPPMSRRQLNYLSHLALQEDWPMTLESFVLYIEEYAGSRDEGRYEILRLDGSLALGWAYTPVHLWRQPAEPLLDLGKPGVIPLMGLMQIQHPARTLPAMVQGIRSKEPDESRQQTLFTSLLAMLDDKEHIAMVEKLLEADELLLDRPFLRRLREKAQIEGRAEGRAEGRTEGRTEGRAEGRNEGMREGLLEGIELGLELKFGLDGLRLLPEIENIKAVGVLRAIREGIKIAQTPDELRRIYRND